jgi:hypothetical protein
VVPLQRKRGRPKKEDVPFVDGGFDVLLHGDPSSILEMATNWLRNDSGATELHKLEEFVQGHRKKHEVFVVQMANSRAAFMSELFLFLRNKLLKEVLSTRRLKAYTDTQLLNLTSMTHRMFESESQYHLQFMQKGPQDLPPMTQGVKGFDHPDPERQAYTTLPSASRERIRYLADLVSQSVKRTAINTTAQPV